MKKKTFISFRIMLLLMIPMLYSLLFIGSMMDPYSKLDQLPVAIVHSNSNEKENPVYKTFVEKKIFSYKYLSKKKAENKLKNGDIYGIIDFKSEGDESNKKTDILLTTSEGTNYTVSKIVTSAMEKYTNKMNQILLQLDRNPNVRNVKVQLLHKEACPIKNNGEGMAPFFFSLTLFVGAIATHSIAMIHFKSRKSTYKDYWKNVFCYPLVFILGQVLFLVGMDYYILGFGKDHIILLFFSLLLVSITYYSIVTAVNRLFPGIGGLIVLILTMLQTSSSAGSYAIYLSNSLFYWINKFIPMTYSVKILRKVLSLNNLNIWSEYTSLIVFLLISQLIVYLSFVKHHKRKSVGEMVEAK